MKNLILRFLVSTAVIFGVAYLSNGSLLVVDGVLTAFWAALVLGLVNLIVRPLVKLVTLPITVFTLGLFSLVINMLMLYLTAWSVAGLETVGILETFVAALIISVVTSLLTWMLDRD